MVIEGKGNDGGLEFWWNPHEFQFKNWLGTNHTLTFQFKYIGTKEYVYFTTVYGASTGGGET